MIVGIDSLVSGIADGTKLAIPQDAAGVSMAATRALVRRGVRGLHLVCVPIGGLQADLLIGAGCVQTIETSAVTLGEFGTGPRFAVALKAGTLQIMDATCPAIHAALQAGQKGIPFIPLRGLLGTDLLTARPDWKVIDNPFAPGDPIVLLPAIVPDVALFHAPLADRHGNVFIGRQRELLTMAHAARRTLVTVEEIVARDLMADPDLAPGVIPATYVTAIAAAPFGAMPVKFRDDYPQDDDAFLAYVAAAANGAAWNRWLAAWLEETDAVPA